MNNLIKTTCGAILCGCFLLTVRHAPGQDDKDKNPFKAAQAPQGQAGGAGVNAPKVGAGFQPVAGAVQGGAPANPYSALLNNPYGVGSMTSNMAMPATTNYMPPYGGWGYNLPDPYGGYLMGAADVINAQGQYLIQTQQAYLYREQVRRAQLENKRALFDDWLYRQANTPTLQDEREKVMREELRRSLNDPPSTEVWSGKTLNILLASVQRSLAGSAGKAAGVNIPIDQDIIKNINVTSGKNGSNIGVFKNEGQLSWPLALRDMPGADDLRKQLDELAKKAYEEAVKGRVDTGTLKEMNALSGKLQQLLVKNVSEIPFSQYNSAKRFLGQLDDGIKALSQPDAANYVNGRYALRGRTIADIVQHMTDNGLVFAPASAGEEAAYKALNFALSAYERATNEAVTQQR